MLVFSYGIPKSGSTLAFRIATGIAMLGGHRQPLQRAELRTIRGHTYNFARELDPAVLPGLAEKFRRRILVVKTHAHPGPEWIAAYESLAARGLVSAHVNHRDPRDICLALLDAGTMARAKGEMAFSEFVTLEDAIAAVDRYLGELATWEQLPEALTLRYEVAAFRMDEAIDAIKVHFGIGCPNWLVRLYAGRIAFTHRNKAIPERHRSEMDPGTAARLTRMFRPYLRQMGYEAVSRGAAASAGPARSPAAARRSG
jgi:hypothetical protein